MMIIIYNVMLSRLNKIKYELNNLILNSGVSKAVKLVSKINEFNIDTKKYNEHLIEYEFFKHVIEHSRKILSGSGSIFGINRTDKLVDSIINSIKRIVDIDDGGITNYTYFNRNKFKILHALLHQYYDIENIEKKLMDFKYNHVFKDVKSPNITYMISQYIHDVLILKKPRNQEIEEEYLVEYNKIINPNRGKLLKNFDDINLKDLSNLNDKMYRYKIATDVRGFDPRSLFINSVYDGLLLHNKNNTLTLKNILPSINNDAENDVFTYEHYFDNFIFITPNDFNKLNKQNDIKQSIIKLMKSKSNDKTYTKPIIATCILTDDDLSHSFTLIAVPTVNNNGFTLYKIDSSRSIDTLYKNNNKGKDSNIFTTLANVKTINNDNYQSDGTCYAHSASATATLLREISEPSGNDNLVRKLSTDDGRKEITESIKKQSILGYAYLSNSDRYNMNNIIDKFDNEQYNDILLEETQQILKTNNFLQNNTSTKQTIHNLLTDIKDMKKQDAQNRFFREKLKSKMKLDKNNDLLQENKKSFISKKYKIYTSVFNGNTIE